MTEGSHGTDRHDVGASMTEEGLAREARSWVTLLLSGEATEQDARRLAEWRQVSTVHEAAFSREARTHALARAAITALRSEDAAWSPQGACAGVNRRLLIGGGVAAAAGVVLAVSARKGPLIANPAENFETGKGERKTLALGTGLSVELNTLSRVSLRDDLGQGGFELLRGEALVTVGQAAGLIQVAAGDARILAGQARLGLRNLPGDLSVTCMEGRARVLLAGREAVLNAGETVAWSTKALGQVARLPRTAVEGWWRGVLVFDNARLGDVIDELNRYREGRIVVANPAIAARRISGAFYIDQLDQVVEQLRLAYGVRILRMPGGVVMVT